MKIAVVHSFYSNAVPSGENTAVEAQVEALKRHGIDVRLISVRTDDLSKQTGYKFKASLNVSFGTGISPLSELNAFKPDIVHVHNLFPNYSTKWLDEWEGPVVATLHNFRSVCAAGTLFRDGQQCEACPRTGSYNAVLHRCYKTSALASLPMAIKTRHGLAGDPLIRRANKLIVLSPRSLDIFSGLGVPQDQMELVPNFVPLKASRSSEHLEHWSYFGRLTEEKGLGNLAREWPQDKVLRIYGDGPLRDWLRENTSANVSVLGSVPSTSVAGLLAESRGLVFPSEWVENAPMIYVEALAAGLPVIAREGNSVADDVILNRTGGVYDESLSLQTAISLVEDNWEQISKNVTRTYDAKFSETAWVNRITPVYRDLVG